MPEHVAGKQHRKAFHRVLTYVFVPVDFKPLTGDIGTIVEHHPATSEYPEGYEVECFTGNGETIAVISVAATSLRQATSQDVMHVRQLTPAAS